MKSNTNLYMQYGMTGDQPFFENRIANVMNVKDVAEFLKVSTKTVYKMSNDGRLNPQRIGNRYRFLRSELDKFMKGE